MRRPIRLGVGVGCAGGRSRCDELTAWARKVGIGVTYDQLLASDQVRALIADAVEGANRELARPEQVKRFAVLSREFSADENEITPTLKLKRQVCVRGAFLGRDRAALRRVNPRERHAEAARLVPSREGHMLDRVARAAPSDYISLKRDIRAAGLFERQPGYYVLRATSSLLLLAAAFFFVLTADSFSVALLASVLLGAAIGQAASFTHDAGHRAILRPGRANDAVGLFFGNVIGGVSWTWWRAKHNAHHAHPNDPDLDPDAKRRPPATGGQWGIESFHAAQAWTELMRGLGWRKSEALVTAIQTRKPLIPM